MSDLNGMPFRTITQIQLTLLIFSLAMMVGFARLSHAGEPDDFAGRADTNAPLANDSLNAILNSLLLEVLTDVNATGKVCSKEVLLRRMFYAFDRNFPEFLSSIRYTAYKQVAGPKEPSQTGLKPFVNKHSFMWLETYKVKTKSGVHMIGLDKIDHFFGHGFLNWSMGRENKKQNQILELNHDQETGAWGLKSTNVKSYADLSANYLGTKFWENLTEGPTPHIICKDGRFTLSRNFDLFEYLDASVDETVNCSSYSSIENRDGFLAYSRTMNSVCPVSKSTCQDLTKSRPGKLGELTLHPLCRGLPHNQVEEPTRHTVSDVLQKASALFSGGENYLSFWMNPRSNQVQTKQGVAVQVSPGWIENVDTPKTTSNESPKSERTGK